MKKFLCILAAMVFAAASLYGQPEAGHYGTVTDERGDTVPYAIVSVMNLGGHIIFNSVCDESGRFHLPESIPDGKYIFKVSCVGYGIGSYEVSLGTGSDLGSFSITAGERLEEAVITASRPVISAEVDRLVYSVEDDPDAARMNSMEVLGKIPFIKVRKETQQIEVLDATNFSILVNGKKSLLLSEANQYVARALAASNLKEIELITSPDGAYVNKDAVINIVTKSSLPEGFVGNAGVSYESNTSLSPSLSFTSKIGRLVYNIDYGYTYSDPRTSYVYEQTEDYVNGERITGEQASGGMPGNTHNINVNASYDIGRNTLLTISGGGSMSDANSRSYSERSYYDMSGGDLKRVLSDGTRIWGDDNSYNGSLNLQQSFDKVPGRLLTATYSIEDKSSRMRYDDGGISDFSMNYLGNREQMAAIDYYSPLGKNQSYYITGKYTHRDYGSRNEYGTYNTMINGGFVNRRDNMDYTQQVFSLGGNYSYRSAKLMFNANVSLEYTKSDAQFGETELKKDNTTLLAEIRTTYKPNPRNWLILTLRRRAFRPDISYLNPYRDISVPGVITVGNPNLDNQITNSAVLMYRYFATDKLTLMSILGYSYDGDMVGNYSYIDGENIVHTYSNVADYQRVWITFNPTYTPFDWLELNADILYGYRKFNDGGVTNSYNEFSAQFRLSADLWKGARFSYSANLQDPDFAVSYNPQVKRQHLMFMDSFGITQNFGSKVNVSLGVSNPWKKYFNDKREIESSQLHTITMTRSLARTVWVRVSYDFGKFKDFVKSARRGARNSDRSRM